MQNIIDEKINRSLGIPSEWLKLPAEDDSENKRRDKLIQMLTRENRELRNEIKRLKTERNLYAPVITTERKRKTKVLRRRLETAISNVTENENKIAAEGIRENARKAGQAKQSPYEKAGTIAAVNKLLEEKKEMLDKRGGKAELTRLIIRKIENDEINAPDIPTEKTVMKWIANFQKQEVNMLTS